MSDPTLDPEYHRGRLLMLAELVRDMRDLQKEFFDPRRRRPDTVGRAKAAEATVDRAVAALLDPPEPTLF